MEMTFSFFMGERAHLEDQLTVYAPGHAREARIALLEAHLPHIRDVDECLGDSFGGVRQLFFFAAIISSSEGALP